ncbi:hypothetical protein [Escherichia coli]|uniref:F4 family fimbrial subunit n=1 Tax=Escherichia coli TaxID=562 RepID=UPI001C407CD3|nr:hypothetical protein [Escherichia coli]
METLQASYSEVSEGALGTAEVFNRLSGISPEFVANITNLKPEKNVNNGAITGTASVFDVAYGSGIEAGTNLTLNLNTAVSSTAIKWKASLPVTVTYA